MKQVKLRSIISVITSCLINCSLCLQPCPCHYLIMINQITSFYVLLRDNKCNILPQAKNIIILLLIFIIAMWTVCILNCLKQDGNHEHCSIQDPKPLSTTDKINRNKTLLQLIKILMGNAGLQIRRTFFFTNMHIEPLQTYNQ